MPGAYAHLTLVNALSETQRLEAIPRFQVEAITSVLDHFKFCELGAVSPDYPYLAVTDADSTEWADLMHYIRTGEMIHVGISKLKALNGETKHKCLAWLLGYAAHVATDVTIHPVIELKAGPYAQNKTRHRVCEMHQDAHIFQRMDLGGVGISEHLESGIWACSQKNTDLLDTDISSLWASMLKAVHPERFKSNQPNINKWHQSFNLMVNKIGEEGNKLMPIARHVAVNCGLTYPEINEIDEQYTKGLKVPGGNMDYDQIFDKAVSNVSNVWGLIVRGVFTDSIDYQSKIGNWNLDTGRDGDGKLAFWN